MPHYYRFSSRIRFRRAALLGFSCAFLASVFPSTAPAAPGLERVQQVCAAYDLHLVILVEDHGQQEVAKPEVLRNAVMTMLGARSACRQGDLQRALQLYDAIHLDPVRMTPFYRVLLR